MTLEHKDKKDRSSSDMKQCAQCGRELSNIYPDDICPSCKEINLFAQVKDYIRENDVKEGDVASHFDISISKVRSWIREGRIQYKDTGDGGANGIKGLHCEICGKPLEFGSLCPECRRLQGLQIVAKKYEEDKSEHGEMYFLGKGKDGRNY